MGKSNALPKVSIVLPTYNEEHNIREMISLLLKHVKDCEVIVSDDDSPDGTWKIVQGISRKDKRVRLIRRFKDKGVGPSIMDGLKAAKGEYLVWMDADLTMPPSLVPQMVSLLKKHDVVIGSRYAQGGSDKRGFVRVITSRLINLLANVVLNFDVLDYDSGFVAVRRWVLNNVSFNPSGHGEYCIEFLYKCTKKGYSVKELGYVFRERTMGESKTSRYIFSVFLYGINYIKRIVKIRLNG